MSTSIRTAGQITLPIAMVGSLLLSVIGFLSSYYGSLNGQAAAVALVDTKVEVLKSKTDTTKEYTDARLDRIEGKINALLTDRGINPDSLVTKK